MNARMKVFWAGVLVAIVAACAQGPRFDIDAEKAALMQADRAFAAETARLGGDGWANFFAVDGTMFPISGGRVDGQDAIRERMRGAFGAGRPRLEWEPTEATVSVGGELGYTVGRWESTTRGAAGQDSVLATGHYVTIWRKDTGQGWRVALDVGNQDPEPAASR